jgi:hypothetical protein
VGRADPGTVISELLSVQELVALAGSVNRRLWETVVFPFVFSCGKAIDAPLFLTSRLCHTENLGD